MKKLNLFLASAVVLMGSFAQLNAGDGPEKIGIRAGYQSSALFLDGEKLDQTDNLGAFYAGLFRDNKLVPFLHLGTGLEYMQAGAKAADSDDKQVLHYLSVPVYLKGKIGPVYALGGAAANFKISEKMIIGGESIDVPDENKSKSFDVPLYVGAGLKFLMFSVEARYHIGMVDLNDGIKNRYLQLGATVAF